MSTQSRISIAMAVYNGERFIQEQLDSFLKQTRLPDELVVSDNASTDRTVEIVREFASCAPFPMRLFINDRNLGVTKNFERAIRECTGDIIFLSDCDDVWYPDKVQQMELSLLENPHAAIVTCNAHLIDEHGLRFPNGDTLWGAIGFAPSKRLARNLAAGKAIASSLSPYGCSMAFLAKLKPLVLPLPDDSIPIRHDGFIVWTVLAAGAGGVAIVPRPLFAYRQHPQQLDGGFRHGQSKFGPLRARLARRATKPPFGPVIARLETADARALCANPAMRAAALRHFRARWTMPKHRLARLLIVLKEFSTLRYHRFSHGFAAAAKDLLFVE